MNFDSCSDTKTDKLIVVQESGRKFELSNKLQHPVRVVRVDGCLICGDSIRCDYIFEIGNPNHCAIYLELKGSDVKHAFAQLEATLHAVRPRHNNCVRVCHIVASRVPRITPDVQQRMKRIARDFKAITRIGTTMVSVSTKESPYAPT